MARKMSSRQPDISLLMLSSMSLPEIFWYSSNTEGRREEIHLIFHDQTHAATHHMNSDGSDSTNRVFAPKTATRGQWNPQSLLHDKYIHVTHNPNDMKPALL